MLVGIFTDLTALRAAQRELEAANQRLHDLAHLDRLTGLPNRMYFEETLAREVANAARQHEIVRRAVHGPQRLQAHQRQPRPSRRRRTDSPGRHTPGADGAARRLLARLGGDEFVVVVRHTDEASARRLAERLAEVVNTPFALAAAEARVTVSIGVALFPRDGTHSDELIKNADAAMYRAKRVTWRAVEFHSPHAATPT